MNARPLPPRAGRKVLAILGTAFACAALASALPDDPYERWQLLDGTIHDRARWIYERIHYDPTPIDVVFIGSSRVGAAVNAPMLGRALAERGLPANVVNFSLPEAGRDINAVIVNEMFQTKRPRLLVIGVNEKPSRFGHSAYKYIAPSGYLIDPGYPINATYLSNLAYLPYRQIELFTARLWPKAIGVTARFDPSRYRGPSIDTTGNVPLPDGTIKNGVVPASAAELNRGVTKYRKGLSAPFLPSQPDLEFGDERHYLREIVEVAKAHRVPVAFLALPYYTGPEALQEQEFYMRYGSVWNASFVASHPEWYSDYAHLTAAGAENVTRWLVARVGAAESR